MISFIFLFFTALAAQALSVMVANVSERPREIKVEQQLDNWLTLLREDQKPSLTVLVNHPLKKEESRKSAPVGVSILSRLPKVHSKNRVVTQTLTIVQATLLLPDQRHLQVLAVRFPDRNKFPVAHDKALKQLAKIRIGLPKKDLVIAAGDFGLSRSVDSLEKISERFLQPHWVMGHQLNCRTPTAQPCQGTSLVAESLQDSFQEMILLDKDFYDGLKGWRVSRDQNLTLRPATPLPGEHWPLIVSFLPN